MFGKRVDPEPQTMGGTKVGRPLEQSSMILDDHAGPVIPGSDVIGSHELGLMESKTYPGAVGAALLQSPNLPTG